MINKTARVAIVDDDPFVLRGLRRLLRSTGFDVDTYATGAEFLSDAAARGADCVVLDLHMPQTSGFDVQVQLARRGLRTPVIVITGDDTPEAKSRALLLGAKSYLGKPIDEATLLAAIADALGSTPSNAKRGDPT